MNHHVLMLEIATKETKPISQRDLALAVALALAEAGILVECVRPVGFISRPDFDAQTGEVCRD